MPKVIALCNVPFGVGVRAKGEVFDATEHEAKILVALRRVALHAEIEPAPPTDPIKQPELTADTGERAKGKKGTYSRRDLSAQD